MSGRILVVDDEEKIRLIIRKYGEFEGYEIDEAAIEQMDGVVSWTSFPGDAGLQAEQMLLDMRDQIFGGQVTAEEGMTSTQDAINALLDAQ